MDQLLRGGLRERRDRYGQRLLGRSVIVGPDRTPNFFHDRLDGRRQRPVSFPAAKRLAVLLNR
jgi:hypothetical protein